MPDGNFIIGILALVGTIVSIGVAVSAAKQQRFLKKMTFATQVYNVINNESSFKEEIEILFKNKKIHKLDLVEIEIKNSGNQSIKRSDIIKTLGLRILDPEVEILSAEITEKAPNNFDIALEILDKEIALSFELMNPGDRFKIRVFVNKFGSINEIEARGRIDNGNFVPLEVVNRNSLPSWKLLFPSNTIEPTLSLIAVGFLMLAILHWVGPIFGFPKPSIDFVALFSFAKYPLLLLILFYFCLFFVIWVIPWIFNKLKNFFQK